jgi:hypothetical protein
MKKSNWKFPVKSKSRRATEHIVRKPVKLGPLVSRARDIQGELDKVRPLYSELDAITSALLDLHDDKKAVARLLALGCILTDNFAEKNTVFRTTGIRRWQISWK